MARLGCSRARDGSRVGWIGAVESCSTADEMSSTQVQGDSTAGEGGLNAVEVSSTHVVGWSTEHRARRKAGPVFVDHG
jgi:hypothetical protein